MQKYYHRTYGLMGVLLTTAMVAAYVTQGLHSNAEERQASLQKEMKTQRVALQNAQKITSETEKEVKPASLFLNLWKPHMGLVTGSQMRSTLEQIAQSKLGLVTDDIVEPEPVEMRFRTQKFKAQRIAIRASGDNITKLLTWLGLAEENYPYAKVESFELGSTSGRNCQIKVTMVMPQPNPAKEVRR